MKQYISHEESSESEDEDCENPIREEWMYLPNLVNAHNVLESQESTIRENTVYWINQCAQYSTESCLNMPTWINTLKSHHFRQKNQTMMLKQKHY